MDWYCKGYISLPHYLDDGQPFIYYDCLYIVGHRLDNSGKDNNPSNTDSD